MPIRRFPFDPPSLHGRRWAVGGPTTRGGAAAQIEPEAYRAFTLDAAGLGADLDTARAVGLRSKAAVAPSDTVISLPAPNGALQRFAIMESPIMEADLAAAHPEITPPR